MLFDKRNETCFAMMVVGLKILLCQSKFKWLKFVIISLLPVDTESFVRGGGGTMIILFGMSC